MKPILVIGLGNELMGDDGVGWRVARLLAADPRLPDDVEVLAGGTDLFRCAAQMERRNAVVLVDAMCSDAPPGSVRIFERELPDEPARSYAHDLSIVGAIRLLRALLGVRIVLVTVSVASIEMRNGLSRAVSEAVPAAIDRVVEELRRLLQLRSRMSYNRAG